MINWINVSDSKINESRLHGNHEAQNVYALDVVIDPNVDGILTCDNVFIGKEHVQFALSNQESLNFEDRIYCGILRVKDIYTGEQNEQEQSRVVETEETADIYPREE
ncbi:hypothetical protein EBPHNEJP_00075 [Salmonella phage CF-SP2]|nr:hypothetical protein EBPHNEJP_00075 [Salmonella phage CF-SP2]